MHSPQVHYLIHKTQYQDRLREIEHDHLLQVAGLSKDSNYRKAAWWLGMQMVKWGSKLQNLDNPDKGCQEASLKIVVPKL